MLRYSSICTPDCLVRAILACRLLMISWDGTLKTEPACIAQLLSSLGGNVRWSCAGSAAVAGLGKVCQVCSTCVSTQDTPQTRALQNSNGGTDNHIWAQAAGRHLVSLSAHVILCQCFHDRCWIQLPLPAPDKQPDELVITKPCRRFNPLIITVT